MPCRVGITTNTQGRKEYWEGQVVGLTGWRILANYKSRDEAQRHETRYAGTSGCQASPGGAPAAGTWSVYRFDYIRTRG